MGEEVTKSFKKKQPGKCCCAAPICRNNKTDHPDVGFFRFPRDPVR